MGWNGVLQRCNRLYCPQTGARGIHAHPQLGCYCWFQPIKLWKLIMRFNKFYAIISNSLSLSKIWQINIRLCDLLLECMILRKICNNILSVPFFLPQLFCLVGDDENELNIIMNTYFQSSWSTFTGLRKFNASKGFFVIPQNTDGIHFQSPRYRKHERTRSKSCFVLLTYMINLYKNWSALASLDRLEKLIDNMMSQFIFSSH